MRQPKPNLVDFANTLPLDEGLSDLHSHFENWQQADGRGKKNLWELLGKAYEFGLEIADNDLARRDLVAKVADDPDVDANNRWHAEKKHPFDLLLVLLLGLNESTKATKSQWLRSLNIAQKQNVDSSQQAFVEWIKKIGGVDAALKLGRKRPKKKKIGEMAKALPEPESLEEVTIKMPLKLSEDDFPDGLGLVIVKKGNKEDEVVPLATVVNKSQVSSVVASFVSQLERAELANEREARRREEEYEQSVRRAARKAYYARKPSERSSDFDEFLEEYKAEHPNEDPHALAPMPRR